MIAITFWMIGYLFWAGYEEDDRYKSWLGSLVFFFCWPIRLGELFKEKQKEG